jgi:tetratricopeptide (TPR) repeat protein
MVRGRLLWSNAPMVPDDTDRPPVPSPSPAAEQPGEKPPEKPDFEARARSFSVDVSNGLEEGLRTLKERASQYVKKGAYTKVRIKFRGRELATLPLTVLLAAEAATFLGGGGILRLLVVNALGRTFLDVEFINEADTVVAAGKQRLLDGDLDEALARFREAIAMDGAHPGAQLNLGIAMKLKGDRAGAQAAFEKSASLDPDGDTGKEARRQLEALKARSG